MARADWMLADLGIMDYRAAHRLQLDLVEARHTGLLDRDLLLLVEHPAVFTLGRRGGRSNLKISEAELRRRRIDVISVERGGDITFHGPGQLVGYLVMSLEKNALNIPRLVRSVEEAMIRTAGDFNLDAVRDARNPGVWVGGEKLGNIGIAIRQGITFHGFSVNVHNDLTPFQWINPCGLAGVNAASLSTLTGRFINMPEVKRLITHHIQDIFDLSLEPAGGAALQPRSSRLTNP